MQDAETKKATRKNYKLSDTIPLEEVKIIAKQPEDIQTSHVRSSRLLYGMPDNELIITPQLQNHHNIMHLIAARIPRVYLNGSELQIQG